MAGGAYDYACTRVHTFISDVEGARPEWESKNPALREKFLRHLEKVAEAMRAIEWADSGNGVDEEAAILAVLPSEIPTKVKAQQVAPGLTVFRVEVPKEDGSQ